MMYMQRNRELDVQVAATELPITAFHGTGNLESIIRSRAIPSMWFNISKRIYGNSRRKYNAQTQDFAQRARVCSSPESDFGGQFDKRYLLHDEALADLVELHSSEGIASVGEKMDYKELKRILFIYCADNLETAQRHNYPEGGAYGGVVEVNLPRVMIRPGLYYIRGYYDTIDVPKHIPSEHWAQIHVHDQDFRRVIDHLDENGLENIPVTRLK